MLRRSFLALGVTFFVVAGHRDGPATASETWSQCLTHLRTEKVSPTYKDASIHEPVCRLWRPSFEAMPAQSSASPRTPCVFSQATFHEGAGLCLATTHDALSVLLSHGVLDEADQGCLERPLFRTTTPGSVKGRETGIPAYQVRTLPGRGQGVVALRHIKQNETFLLDHPAVLVAWSLIGMAWTETQESFLNTAVQNLPKHTRTKVRNLSSTGLIPNFPLCDIFKTNVCGFSLGIDTKVPHLSLYTEFARINHACVPNAFYRVSPRDLILEVVAFRDIEPGEEIYINYSPHAMPYRDRQRYLQEEYGFACSCPLCSLSKQKRDTSDQHRMDLAVLGDEISLAMRQRRWPDVAHYASEAVERLSFAEVLDPGLTDHSLTELYIGQFEALAESHLRMGNVDMAKHFAEKALDVASYLRGAQSHAAQHIRNFIGALRA